MSYRVKDIMHESGSAWVLRDRKQDCYTVFVIGATHSTSDSSYALTEDGLSIAVARANYLARRERERQTSTSSMGKPDAA